MDQFPEPLPCPFCGSVAIHTVADRSVKMIDMVVCTGKDCFAQIESNYNPGSALEMWNRRVTNKQLRDVVTVHNFTFDK